MATELEHTFSTEKSIDDGFAAIADLERVVPAVEGGRVLETTGPGSVKAEIVDVVRRGSAALLAWLLRTRL